ncbi:MAG: ATP-binding protein, partial [Planctomycetota bacterium]|nr:ATP-binding protein [Planctomycetota bacterium]
LRPEEADVCIHGIEQEVALLDRLVGDLVETARIESEANSVRPNTFMLLNWASETLRRLESKVRSCQIDWTTKLPEQDREISGDPQRLAQAVGNLVDNAINALEGRSDPRIEVSIVMDEDRWSLDVDDNGRGIPEDELPHVFRRFYRVERHRGREQGGVGLGLSLVRAIAEAHGGEASIESQAEKGTKVTITIPFKRN